MDGNRFDGFAKALANDVNRRSIVKWILTGIAGGVSGGIGSASAQPCGQAGSFCGGAGEPACCPGLQCVGAVRTCQPCAKAGDFCGGTYPSCCGGLQCMGAVPTCQGSGGSWGDTHLITFNGLLYDFQASGDFVVAQRAPDFVVQSRQVSLAPTWPDVSINTAVATRIGELVVTICRGRSPLSVDGQAVELRDGDELLLPDGVTVTRKGDSYTVASSIGDSVSARIMSGSGGYNYIDIAVGLGDVAGEVSGLLASPDIGAIQASDGTVFTSPFSFADLYQHFADSWRVDPSESLLMICGAAEEPGVPRQPFYAEDLDPEIAESARALCVEAEVTDDYFLDACALDVAAIGDQAVQGYVGRPAPNQVGVVAP